MLATTQLQGFSFSIRIRVGENMRERVSPLCDGHEEVL